MHVVEWARAGLYLVRSTTSPVCGDRGIYALLRRLLVSLRSFVRISYLVVYFSLLSFKEVDPVETIATVGL